MFVLLLLASFATSSIASPDWESSSPPANVEIEELSNLDEATYALVYRPDEGARDQVLVSRQGKQTFLGSKTRPDAAGLLSADGEEFLLVTHGPGKFERKIYSFNLEGALLMSSGGSAQAHPSVAFQRFAWSSRWHMLAYSWKAEGKVGVAISDLDSEGHVPLTISGYAAPAWASVDTPDDTMFVFRLQEGENFLLYVLASSRVSGSLRLSNPQDRAQVLILGSESAPPFISPTGDWLITEDGRLYWVPSGMGIAIGGGNPSPFANPVGFTRSGDLIVRRQDEEGETLVLISLSALASFAELEKGGATGLEERELLRVTGAQVKSFDMHP